MNRSTMAFAAMMLLTVFALSCKKPVVPDGGEGDVTDDTTVFQPEYVDLGLPSGTLWAVCNVGTTIPEGFGDYFAWGETSTKELYNWNNYIYGNVVNGKFELTKYCLDASYGLDGFVDSLTLLESSDDAATVRWGAEWRLPTKEEWKELYMKTTNTHAVQNGVEGWLFMASNGNTLFLPSAGFCLDGGPLCTGIGTYWSSSLHTDYLDRGWSFHFDFDECHVCGTYERCRGQVVRAVRATK